MRVLFPDGSSGSGHAFGARDPRAQALQVVDGVDVLAKPDPGGAVSGTPRLSVTSREFLRRLSELAQFERAVKGRLSNCHYALRGHR
jgi:hypothetical protein